MPDKTPPELAHCPFCGSNNLTINLWSMDDGEIDAAECNDCCAGAPLSAWNMRAQETGEILDVRRCHKNPETSDRVRGPGK